MGPNPLRVGCFSFQKVKLEPEHQSKKIKGNDSEKRQNNSRLLNVIN